MATSLAGVSISSSLARFVAGSSTNFTSATEVSRAVLGIALDRLLSISVESRVLVMRASELALRQKLRRRSTEACVSSLEPSLGRERAEKGRRADDSEEWSGLGRFD